MTPFGRRRRRPVDDDSEAALRADLRRLAERAPDPADVTARILAATERASPVERPAAAPRPWRTFGLPLVAAATVAAVVGGVVAIEHYDPSPDRLTATHGTSTPAPTTKPVPTPSRPSRTSHPSTTTPGPVDTSTLHGVRVVDLTFTGENTGWALASALCIGKAGRCTALLHTTDGTSYVSRPRTPFDVPGITGGCPAATCVEHIRFANDKVGYAFGPSAFYLTTDGANSWQHLSGGALALETLDDNVIRIVSDHSGCPGPCNVRAETSAIGSADWTTRSLSAQPVDGYSVSFSRGGSNAYLLLAGNPASGSAARLFRSADDGVDWTESGDPCLRRAEFRGVAVAAGNGSDVTTLCSPQEADAAVAAVSTDGGAHFVLTSATLPLEAIATSSSAPLAGLGLDTMLAGDPSTVLVVAGSAGLTSSTDGGRSWHRVGSATGAFASVGFESTTVGRALSSNRNAIWTTRDAGRSWTGVSLG